MADKQTLQQELDRLQEEYAKTKDNKATNKYVGLLRAKMARVRRSLAERKSKRGIGFGVKKTGDATVVLVGFPNAGKSSLINRITDANSKVAEYAFTTLDTIPGMLDYNGARIQVLDVPGLIEGAHLGKGAGTQVASVIRIADLLLFVLDATDPEQIYKIMEELALLNIRVNTEKPRVDIEEKSFGGLAVESNDHKVPDINEIRAILREIGVYNGKIIFHSSITGDELVALLVEKAIYVRGILALNKIDLLSESKVEQLRKELASKLKMQVIPVSMEEGTNIERLKEMIFDNLDIIRIYLKPKDSEPDFSKPFVLRHSGTVLDLAKGIHSKMAESLRYAYVTGRSAKFRNQKVGGEHVLKDGDIVTLVYEKYADA
jgi:hypothetical protein